MQETFASYVKDYYIGKFGASVASYDQQYLKNTTPAVAESGKCQPDIQCYQISRFKSLEWNCVHGYFQMSSKHCLMLINSMHSTVDFL